MIIVMRFLRIFIFIVHGLSLFKFRVSLILSFLSLFSMNTVRKMNSNSNN